MVKYTLVLGTAKRLHLIAPCKCGVESSNVIVHVRPFNFNIELGYVTSEPLPHESGVNMIAAANGSSMGHRNTRSQDNAGWWGLSDVVCLVTR